MACRSYVDRLLARLSAEDAAAEMEESRSALAEIIGYEPAFFAYPNGQPGDFTPTTEAHLRGANWRAAFTTIPEVAQSGCDPFWIPRLPLGSGSAKRLAWSFLRAS